MRRVEEERVVAGKYYATLMDSGERASFPCRPRETRLSEAARTFSTVTMFQALRK